MTEKMYDDAVLGPVLIRKSPRARRISLRVNRRREVVLTLPCLAAYRLGIAFLESRREWVLEALARMPEAPPENAERVEELRKRAKATLPPRLEELARLHGFHYNKVFIKNNASNWGSCSSRGNINLNLRLAALPQELQDYVMLHELCHLKEMNHGPAFHALLESVCPDHRRLQKELRGCPLLP